MRRLALSVFTACGLLAFSACGGTGLTGNTTQSPTQLVFTNGSGQVNDFIVSPLNTSPTFQSQALPVSVVAQAGAGPAALLVPNVSFTWAARFVTSADPPNVQEYLTGISPNGYKQCSFATATPAIPIYYVPSGQTTLQKLPAATTTANVFIAPVAGVTAPYCMVLQATANPGQVIGSITVAVTN